MINLREAARSNIKRRPASPNLPWWNPPQLRPVFQFLLGMAVAFHMSLTISAVHSHQADLKVLGFFLSSVLIVIGNVLILAVLGISLFSKTPTFSQYVSSMAKDTTLAWKKSIDVGWLGAKRVYHMIEAKKWTQ